MVRQLPCSFLLITVISCLFANHTVGASAPHPLDALDASEIAAAAAILREAGHADKATLFSSITLQEPPKETVLAWRKGKPIPRAASVVLRRDSKTYEAIVDLRKSEIVTFRAVPGVQPPLVLPELMAAIETALGDARMQEGLRKRGITDFDELCCIPLTVGNFGREDEQSRRLIKVHCFDIGGGSVDMATPIEGLFATVDVDRREVIEVTDSGVVPIPPGRPRLDPDSIGTMHEVKPMHFSSPEGSNFTIDGSVAAWQNWSFHVRWDFRMGIVLSLVSWNEGNGDEAPRSVLYQGSLAEIFVPYQIPTVGWYNRNFMDEGEYGLGTMGTELVPGPDCPETAAFLSPVMANAAGGADTLENRICIFERPTGAPLWRHTDFASGEAQSRPALELVVRYIATVGNYDYVFDWLFDQKGNLTFRGGASGIDTIKGVAAMNLSDPSAAEDTAWGPLIAPGRVGINHDHFFSIRLDLDVDGTRNSFVRDTLVVEQLGEDSPRRSIWRVKPETSKKDSEAKYRLSYERPALWRVVNPNRRNGVGYPVSYAIESSGNALPLVAENDPPLARAFFANYHVWVTPYDSEERFAAGKYPNQSKAGVGLPAWTAKGRDVENQDIVLWYTLGFHHVPSSEDWPVYNLGWHQVTLRPYNFFDRNPALDVPPATSRVR